MGLGHEPNPEDAAIWSAKTAIIRFNVVEMHHSDRVKMQFRMHQEIPSDPTCLSPWHLKRVDAQWGLTNWKDFAPEWCKMWQRRHRYVLQFPVFLIQGNMRHSDQYLSWYRSVSNPEMHVSHPRYLVDPRTQWAQPSFPQQQTQNTSTSHQPPRRNRTTNTQPQSPP